MLQVIVRPGELVYLCKEMFHSTWLYDVGHILYGGVHSSVCVIGDSVFTDGCM